MPSYPNEASREKIEALSRQIDDLKTELYHLKQEIEPMPVKDYVFQTVARPVTLSEMFGDKTDLIVIHNMGKACSYCTMWADGFIGLTHYLEDRAAFWLVSPDEPKVQTAFALERGWNFKTASDAKPSSFTSDLGYWNEKEGYWPGASAFKKQADGSIIRVAQAVFGPMDDFCSAWPLFALLQGGAGDWEPRYLLPNR